MEPIRRKSKIAIIEETVAYYSADPVGRRGINPDKQKGVYCQYKTADGKMCAAGRCMVDPQQDWVGPVTNIWVGNSGTIVPVWKPEYEGHDIAFWRDLQRLHDNGDYWTKTEMHENGKIYADKLLEKYKDQ